MDIPIIFEDASFLVIDKPAGLVVNRSDTTRQVETVQDWMESKYSISNTNFPGDQELIVEFKSRGGVVHRLDKDTSGILVLAKTPMAFSKLKNQFKERTTVKKYLALCHGLVEPAFGTINAPIERSPFNRKHFGIFAGGREAQTDYKTIRNINCAIKDDGKEMETLTLLELTPHTGRTHQIRVHLKYLNHPVICDPIYGGRKNYQNDQKFFPRLFLHATSLAIVHPETGKALKFESPLPLDLQIALDSLPIK